MAKPLAFKASSRIGDIRPDIDLDVASLKGTGQCAGSKCENDMLCGNFLVVSSKDDSLNFCDALLLETLKEFLITQIHEVFLRDHAPARV